MREDIVQKLKDAAGEYGIEVHRNGIMDIDAAEDKLFAAIEQCAAELIEQGKADAAQSAGVRAPALVTAAQKVIDEFGTSSDGLQDLYQALKPHTAPPAARREPLTTTEVEQILAQWDYTTHGDRARYIVRMTEAAHGITEVKQ